MRANIGTRAQLRVHVQLGRVASPRGSNLLLWNVACHVETWVCLVLSGEDGVGSMMRQGMIAMSEVCGLCALVLMDSLPKLKRLGRPRQAADVVRCGSVGILGASRAKANIVGRHT